MSSDNPPAGDSGGGPAGEEARPVVHRIGTAVRPAGGRRASRRTLGVRDAAGDWFELTESSHLRTLPGRFFCVYALASVLPLLAAKQRQLPPETG